MRLPKATNGRCLTTPNFTNALYNTNYVTNFVCENNFVIKAKF